MNTSESIIELATALAKAQGQVQGAKKDAENPHFRSKYADLASTWDACREALTAHALAVVQSPRLINLGENLWMVEVETMLTHASGQWMRDTLALPVNALTAQGLGSAITYGRRYALAAFIGIAPEDDDGNAAVGSSGGDYSRPKTLPVVKPAFVTKDQAQSIVDMAKLHGWDEPKLKAYLKTYCKVSRIIDLPAKNFDDVLAAMEAGPDYEAPL